MALMQKGICPAKSAMSSWSLATMGRMPFFVMENRRSTLQAKPSFPPQPKVNNGNHARQATVVNRQFQELRQLRPRNERRQPMIYGYDPSTDIVYKDGQPYTYIAEGTISREKFFKEEWQEGDLLLPIEKPRPALSSDMERKVERLVDLSTADIILRLIGIGR